MKKIISSLSIIGLLFVSTLSNAATPIRIDFKDVTSVTSNGRAIGYLAAEGIIAGYPDGTFGPKKNINRAELMKIVVESSFGTPADTYAECFPDVTNQWFAKYVCYGKSKGWVGGYPDGTFKPSQNVSDVESLKIVLNALGIAVVEAKADPFTDVSKGEWFAPYVATAKAHGFLEENGAMFKPGKLMTRAGVSENMFRVLATKKENATVYTPEIGVKVSSEAYMKIGDIKGESKDSMDSSGEAEANAEANAEVNADVKIPDIDGDMEAKASAWVSVSTESELTFEAAGHDGEFKDFTVTIVPDEESPEDMTKSKISVEIDVDSISTDSDGLTGHLKQEDFFDVAKHPTATFTSTAIAEADGEGMYTVTGTLEIKGVKQSVTFDAMIMDSKLTMTYQLDRLAFGIGEKDGAKADQYIPLDIMVMFE